MRELKIDEQIWAIDNLDVTTYRNGDCIPCVEDSEEWKNLKTGAWCYFANNAENNTTYGKLYNYFAIVDERGLAPDGYRIPSHYDWLSIQKFGSRLKSKNDWTENDHLDFYVPFNAKPGGYRDHNGSFLYGNEAVGWWASTQRDFKNQVNIAHWLYQNDSQLGWKPFCENSGFYVRCLKNTYETKDVVINDNLQVFCSSFCLKYTYMTTLQEVLDLIYQRFLYGVVNPYSYGKEWVIQVYDGEHIQKINKISDKDHRYFHSVLTSQYYDIYRKTEFQIIVSRL